MRALGESMALKFVEVLAKKYPGGWGKFKDDAAVAEMVEFEARAIVLNAVPYAQVDKLDEAVRKSITISNDGIHVDFAGVLKVVLEKTPE